MLEDPARDHQFSYAGGANDASGRDVPGDRPNQLRLLWAVLLGVTALYAVAPLAGWLIVGVWIGVFAQPWHRRLTRAFLGRSNFAAFFAVSLLVMLLVPCAILIVSLILDLIAFAQRLARSGQAHDILQQLVARSGQQQANGQQGTESIAHLLLGQVDRAWGLATQVIGATAFGVLGLLLLVIGVYVIMVSRAEWYAWLEQHVPLLPPAALRRYTEAFLETGHGMFYAIVVAGLFHAVLAAIAYTIIQLPDVLALGALTLIFSVVPVIGTAAVWIPISVGLALEGRYEAALFLVIWSVVVIGVLDHFLRPYIARRGRLALPFYVVLITMASGALVFGAWGLIYGPLLARLAKEALVMPAEAYTETRWHGTA
jgi:predicted PurR-regulated permease PerM